MVWPSKLAHACFLENTDTMHSESLGASHSARISGRTAPWHRRRPYSHCHAVVLT